MYQADSYVRNSLIDFEINIRMNRGQISSCKYWFAFSLSDIFHTISRLEDSLRYSGKISDVLV